MKRRVAGAVTLSLAFFAAGCIDKSRVNADCRWTDGPAAQLDLSRAADREHLRQDAQIANELMVRWGDAHGAHRPDLQRPYRDACIAALTDTITARHAVTLAEVNAAAHARVWWVDALLVYLPMALVIALAMDAVVRRVCRSFDSDDRVIATVSVCLLTPLVALLGMGVSQFWAFEVESWLLRNGHVSHRAFFIPAVAHGWWAYFAALVLCAAVSGVRFRRTPLTGSDHSYAAHRRRPLGRAAV